MFRKEPDAARLWSPELVESRALLQTNILENAARAVCPGGRLLYATCTWSPEENEEQIARFLIRHPDFSQEAPAPAVTASSAPGLSVPGLDETKCRRFYPHLFPGEGQFLSILRRDGERPPRAARTFPSEKTDPEKSLVRAFFEEALSAPPPGILYRRDDLWYLVPEESFARDAVSPGLIVGEIRKGRFVPHHRLFMAGFAAFRKTLELSGTEALRYLQGEELPCPLPDGWARVTYLGCPLGGVKVVEGRAKNHYPKGLRRMYHV